MNEAPEILFKDGKDFQRNGLSTASSETDRSMSKVSNPGRSRKIPLRLVLVAPFVLEIFAAVGLTGYLSFRNGQQAVDTLATKFRGEISNRIDQHLHDYFETPQSINKINAESIRLNQLDITDPVSLEKQLWKQINLYPAIKYLGFGTEWGGYVGTGRETDDSDQEILTIEATDDYVPGNFTVYGTDDAGNRQQVISVTPDYDPRKRDWYSSAVTAGKPRWSDVYSFFPLPFLGISATQPIFDEDGTLQGVLAADLELSGIQDFLTNLTILESGQTFIIERNGLIIASSTEELPFIEPDADEEPVRLLAIDSQESIIQLAAQQLEAEFGDLQAVKAPSQFTFDLDGEKHFAQITPVAADLGLDWLIVVIVPESDFMAQINENTRNTILLCIGALIVATGLGILTTRWIAKPILRLNKASQAIAQSAQSSSTSKELTQQVKVRGIRELESLAHTFNQMAEQLRASFAALEDTNATLESRVEQRTEELSEALNDLRTTQLQLIQQEKLSSLGQMVAGVAHEINNPISFIYGNILYARRYTQDLLSLVELYQREYPKANPQIKETVEEIELDFLISDLPKILDSMKLGAERIREIVLSLRNFSRVDQTAQKIVDIHEGLDSTLHILHHRLQADGTRPEIRVIKSYQPLPEITCYPGQLNQVFMNILSNAIDALEEGLAQTQDCDTPGKSLRITAAPCIQVRTAIADPKTVAIQIMDNGPGIDPEVADKIFNPFFTTKTDGKGTGLGLLLSYQIVVENHGGTLDYRPGPDGGAEFEIRIPIVG